MPLLVPFRSVANIWRQLSPKMRGTMILGVPILCSVAIFATWMSTRASIRFDEKWVDHTEQLIADSNELMLKVITLESTVWRSAIAAHVVDLQLTQTSIQQINTLSQTLYQHTQDNPDQQHRWRQIQTLIQARLDQLQQLSQELQNPLLGPSRRLNLTPRLIAGEDDTDALRQAIATFQTEERHLLAMRRNRLRNNLNATALMGWSLLLGSLASSAGAVYLFWVLDFERNEQDRQLQQSQQLTEAIANSVVDGVIILNRQNEVEIFNPSALKMFGYAPHEVQGRFLQDFLETPPKQSSLNTSPGILKTQGVRKNGETFTVEASYNLVQLNQRHLVIVRDISAQEQINQHLERYAMDLEKLNAALTTSNKALVERNQELDQFVYGAAHDLRAPLRAINHLSEWLEEDLDNALSSENRHQFHLLRGRVQRMAALLEGLATYAQMGRVRQRPEWVDVGSRLHQMIEKLDYPPSFTIRVHHPMPTIWAHADYIEQVFSQLIDNAVKFHHRDVGCISIHGRSADEFWEFEVRDDGPGIDPAFHNKVFQVFQTLKPRDQLETTGIGLAIVAKILTTVGGDISLDSAHGQGTTVRFTWPKKTLPQAG